MSYHWAVGVSFVSALLYHVSYRGFMCCMIDDAVAAGAVHLVAGAWGLVAAGFTGVEAARVEAGYQPEHVCSRGSQTLVNLLMTVIIFVYVSPVDFCLCRIDQGETDRSCFVCTPARIDTFDRARNLPGIYRVIVSGVCIFPFHNFYD